MLKWVFGADTSPFRRSLNEMRDDVKSFAGSAKGHLAGMFAGAALLGAAKAIIDHFARIKDLADRFGESAESMQRVGAAAEQSGMDIETVAKALTVSTKNAVEATNENDDLSNSFVRLGIDAAKFANLPIEETLLAMNAGYNANSDKAQALADVMKVLGKAGAEAIPLLTQGQAELQDQLENTVVASEGTVAAIARMDDQLAKLKQVSMVVGAAILGSFKFAFETVGAVGGTILLNILNTFKTLGSVGANVAVMIGKLATGDVSGALEAGKNAGKAISKGFNQGLENTQKGIDAIGDSFNETFGGAGSSGGGPDVEKLKQAEEAAAAAKKTDEQRKKLAEEIGKLEEDARIKSLSLTEKILDAEKRRAALAADALFGDDETKALEARKEQLKVESEIAGYRKEQADLTERTDKESADKKEKFINEIAALVKESAELERENKLAGMSDSDKREFLKKERAQALKDAQNAGKNGNAKGELEAGNRAKSLTGEIDDLTRSMNDDLQSQLEDARSGVPMIATSSLAEIGGGGGARLMENDNGRRIVDLLGQIAANTAGGAEGSRPPEPVT